MNIKPNQVGASFDVVVILDPLSKGTNALHLSFIRFVLQATVATLPLATANSKKRETMWWKCSLLVNSDFEAVTFDKL